MGNIINNWQQFNENNRESYDYSCLMIYYTCDRINDIHNLIKEEDLHENGIEKDIHTTLLYGLHDDEVTYDQIEDIMERYESEITPLELYNPSLFENEDFDVLKFDVKQILSDKDIEEGIEYNTANDYLYKMNNDLSELPHTTNYPDYHPHSTIAYLKPGKGKEYVKLINDEFKKDDILLVKPTKFVYSRANGEKIEKSIDLDFEK
jgi:2'-5' RNA ligase